MVGRVDVVLVLVTRQCVDVSRWLVVAVTRGGGVQVGGVVCAGESEAVVSLFPCHSPSHLSLLIVIVNEYKKSLVK